MWLDVCTVVAPLTAACSHLNPFIVAAGCNDTRRRGIFMYHFFLIARLRKK